MKNEFFGRLNDPTASSYVKGVCGEEVEYYLVIRDGIIHDVKYYTEGCQDILCCGQAVCRRVKGKSVEDALCVSPGEIIHSNECEFDDGRHCAILAVIGFLKAAADYMLQP